MRRPASLVPALVVAALAGCSSPPEGAARIEVNLPEQALNIPGGPAVWANLHADDDVTVNLVRLSAPIAMHRHLQSEEVVYLLSGEGILHLNGSDRAMEAGDLFVVPRNTPHGFEPTGPSPAIALSIFTPPQVEGDRIYEGAKK